MASRPTITVGTRGSPLAMRQTELVVASLRAQDPEAQIEIILQRAREEFPEVAPRIIPGSTKLVAQR